MQEEKEMRLPIKKKKAVLRKKVVKRGSIKVVKRANYIHPFTNIAKKMSKKDLIKYISTIINFGSPNYVIARDILKRLYGMSEDQINSEVVKYNKLNEMYRDAKLYYNGKITASQFLSKYGNPKGIDTKEKLDDFVKTNTFEITNSNYQKISPEKIVIERRYQPAENAIDDRDKFNTFTIPKRTEPSGQRQLSLNLIYDYLRLVKDLNHKLSIGQISKSKVDFEKTKYLLDLAISRPEYSAVVAYMIFNENANITDDFNTMKNQFSLLGKGTKSKFIELMKNYIMEKNKSPPLSNVWDRGSWIINGKREKLPSSYIEPINIEKSKHKSNLQLLQIEEDVRQKEFGDKISYNNYLEAKRLHPEKYPTKELFDVAQKKLYISKHTTNTRPMIDKIDSEIMKGVIDNEDTEHYYNTEERRKRRLKVTKRPIKKSTKRPIKKPIKKCRCQ